MKKMNLVFFTVVMFNVLVLCSCGGGGGDENPTTPTEQIGVALNIAGADFVDKTKANKWDPTTGTALIKTATGDGSDAYLRWPVSGLAEGKIFRVIIQTSGSGVIKIQVKGGENYNFPTYAGETGIEIGETTWDLSLGPLTGVMGPDGLFYIRFLSTGTYTFHEIRVSLE